MGGTRMKKVISAIAVLSLALSCFTACGRVENPNKKNGNGELTAENTASAVTGETSSTTTLSPAEISLMAEKSSREAILKAKSEASSLLEEKQAQKDSENQSSVKTAASSKSTVSKKTSAPKKTTAKTTRGRYESKPGAYVTKPSALNARQTRAWLVKDVSGLDIRISRLEYGSKTQMFDSSVSSQIVNPKKITYTPACTVAVIKCDSPTRLKISKGTEKNKTEKNAVNAGAVIAIDGTKKSYSTSTGAVIRSGSLYLEFTGSKAKKTNLVMYKNGRWEFMPLDNDAAKAAIKNGAYNSLSIQDITIKDGKIVSSYSDSPCRNRTFLGQINANKYVFMTCEFMPIQSAAEIMLSYGVKNAVQVCGGNCTYMYLKNAGNTTGSKGAGIKGLNKLGYLETEWMAVNGLLKSGKYGSPCKDEMDCIYFK